MRTLDRLRRAALDAAGGSGAPPPPAAYPCRTLFTSSDLSAADVTVVLTRAGFDVMPSRPFRSTLLDTFDGRLHASGLRLEVRTDAAGIELILAGGDGTSAHAATATVPRLAGDLPGGPFRSRLAPVLDVRALLPVVTVTARHTLAIQRDSAGKARATVSVYDQIAVEGRDPVLPAWAAEVTGMAGYVKAGDRARDLLGALGLRRTDRDLIDTVVAAAGIDRRGFSSSPTVALGPDERALPAFRRVLANLAAAIDANWQGTVDDIDAEFLHDLRVAVRRTRSVLSQGRRVLPAEVRDRYREAFAWMGTITTPARDLDVYAIEWDSYVSPLGDDAAAALRPVLHHIEQRRRAEHAVLAEELRSVRYRETMAAWRAWLDDPMAGGGGPKEAGLPIGEVAADRIGRAQDQLVGRGRAIDDATPAEELHELRKDAKKLRYLLECFGGLYAPVPRKAFVQRLKAVQDNLGNHQDAEVHADQLRAISAELYDGDGVGPDTMVAMGRLTESLERVRQAARDEFSERFAAYHTKLTRRALKELLDSTSGR